MENNMKKNAYIYAYVCVTESLCCTAENNTSIVYINYTSIKYKRQGKNKNILFPKYYVNSV